MTRKSSAELLREAAEQQDSFGHALVDKGEFRYAVLMFMRAEECRKDAVISDQIAAWRKSRGYD